MTNIPPAMTLEDAFAAIPAALPDETLDRSLLERYATCPFQALAVETGLVKDGGFEADSGTECHRVIGEGIDHYLRGGDFIDYCRQEIPKMRPDVQHDAGPNLWRSVHGLARLLRWTVPPGPDCPEGVRRSPEDIIRYQGGQGEQTGQVSWPLLPATATRGQIIVTSEVDLLLAESASEMTEIDFKRHKVFTGADIKASFQFRLHAWLLFHIHAELEVLRTKVWNVPKGSITPAAVFARRDADEFAGTLLEAVRYRSEAHVLAIKAELHNIAAWPHTEKCVVCPAVRDCLKTPTPCVALNMEPARFAASLQVREIAVQKDRALLIRYVTDHGEDFGKGLSFGIGKPKPPQKPVASTFRFYDTPGEDQPDAEAAKE